MFNINLDIEIDRNSSKPEGFDYDSTRVQSQIKYDIEPSLKSWGISGFVISVPDQELMFDVDCMDENGDLSIFSFIVNLSNCKVDGDLSEYNNLRNDIAPENIEITLTDLKVSGSTINANASGVLLFC